MAVTCRNVAAPAFPAAVARATTASWSIARKASWLPACLMVVPSAQNTSSTAGRSGTSGRAAGSWVSPGSLVSTFLRPTVTTRSQVSSWSRRRSRCPPTSPVAPASRAVRTGPAYGNRLSGVYADGQTRGMAQLTRPETRLHASFLAAMEEFREEGRAGEDTMIGWDFTRWGATWESKDVFAAYVRETIEEEHRPRAEGFVCQTNWWWTDQDEYVGPIS